MLNIFSFIITFHVIKRSELPACDKCRLQTGSLYIVLPLPLLITNHKLANRSVSVCICRTPRSCTRNVLERAESLSQSQKQVLVDGESSRLDPRIAHFQKEWKSGATVGARSIKGSSGRRSHICFLRIHPCLLCGLYFVNNKLLLCQFEV